MAVLTETGSVPLSRWPTIDNGTVEGFADRIHAIAELHQPSRMAFFRRLAALPRRKACDPAMLGRIYLTYQAAMHATRAAVYFLPHLDAPALRRRKLQIYIDDDALPGGIDDDALPGGDTHHYQLARAFRSVGAALPLDDEEFGDLDELCRHLDRGTAHFVRLAKGLYSRSLGPWCIVEVMSEDWMRALAQALAVHHPQIVEAPYFADCFSQHVEERHAAEALEVTQIVLHARPYLLDETLRDAETMAEALDAVWEHLDAIVQGAE